MPADRRHRYPPGVDFELCERRVDAAREATDTLRSAGAAATVERRAGLAHAFAGAFDAELPALLAGLR